MRRMRAYSYRCHSKFAMYPHAKTVEGAAVGIEARIYDALGIAREPKRLSNVHAVKHIQAAFHASLNGSVADKTIHAAKRQVFRMNLGDEEYIHMAHTQEEK